MRDVSYSLVSWTAKEMPFYSVIQPDKHLSGCLVSCQKKTKYSIRLKRGQSMTKWTSSWFTLGFFFFFNSFPGIRLVWETPYKMYTALKWKIETRQVQIPLHWCQFFFVQPQIVLISTHLVCLLKYIKIRFQLNVLFCLQFFWRRTQPTSKYPVLLRTEWGRVTQRSISTWQTPIITPLSPLRVSLDSRGPRWVNMNDSGDTTLEIRSVGVSETRFARY